MGSALIPGLQVACLIFLPVSVIGKIFRYIYRAYYLQTISCKITRALYEPKVMEKMDLPVLFIYRKNG